MFTRALSLLAPATAAEARDSAPLGSINDPNTPLYQALAGIDLEGAGGGTSPIAGLPAMSVRSAPRISAVYRGTSVIANTIGALPLQTFRERADGSAERVKLPSERYIWGEPNPERTRIDFWSQELAHCVIAGEAFLHVGVNGLGQPVELWPIHPSRVFIGRGEPDRFGRRQRFYTLDDAKNDLPLTDWNAGGTVIHIPNLRLDGEHGLNPIAYMRRTLQVSAAAEEYGARVFANGSTPGGYLSTDADLEPGQIEKLRANWEKHQRGLSNAYRTAILDNGAKWAATSLKPEEAQFLDTRHFQVEEVARILGVPPHLLFESRGSTSWGSGLEEQTTAFVVFTLGHYSSRFEQALSDQLLAKPTNHYARFNYGGLLRGRTLERYQAYQIAIMNGILSPNEARRLEELAPRDGGDKFMRPANLVEVGAPAPGAAAPRSLEAMIEEIVARMIPPRENP